jgi:hypothetical protein
MKKCGSLVSPPTNVSSFNGMGAEKSRPISVSGKDLWPGTVPNRYTPGHLVPTLTPRGETHNDYPKSGKSQST